MQYSKEELEKKIRESKLFSCSKEEDYVLYKREANRMLEYLYLYLKAVRDREIDEFGKEMVEVASNCIKNYSAESGEFLHYFIAAWSREKKHRIHNQKQRRDKYGGLGISSKDRELMRSLNKYLEGKSDTEKRGLIPIFAQENGRHVSEIITLFRLMDDGVFSTEGTNEGYVAKDVLESLIDWKYPGNFEEADKGLKKQLDKIEKLYLSLQERQKPIISDIITARVLTGVDDLPDTEYSFLSESVIKQYTQTGTVPSQRDIALKYNRKEASISRTLREFLEKLRDLR